MPTNKVLLAFNSNLLCAFSFAIAGSIIVSTPLTTVVTGGDAAKKADVQEGGHENILTTQEYVKNVNEDMSEDDHFTQGPWVSAIVYLHGQWVIASGCLGDMENIPKMGSLN
nr:hypothetical protein [Tanacetum cinerariifolium]